jgi:hypothetical protein
MASRHCDVPCFVPPHPSILAKIKADLLGAQDTGYVEAIKSVFDTLHGEKGIPGMNDGTIFSRSHYAEPTSVMAMGNAALERIPLRGTIRHASQPRWRDVSRLLTCQGHHRSRRITRCQIVSWRQAANGRFVVLH